MSQNSSVYYNIERDRKSYFWIMTAIEKVTFVFIKLIILAVTDNTLSEIGKTECRCSEPINYIFPILGDFLAFWLNTIIYNALQKERDVGKIQKLISERTFWIGIRKIGVDFSLSVIS